MAFGQEPGGPPADPTTVALDAESTANVTEAPRKRPALRVVKSDD